MEKKIRKPSEINEATVKNKIKEKTDKQNEGNSEKGNKKKREKKKEKKQKHTLIKIMEKISVSAFSFENFFPVPLLGRFVCQSFRLPSVVTQTLRSVVYSVVSPSNCFSSSV